MTSEQWWKDRLANIRRSLPYLRLMAGGLREIRQSDYLVAIREAIEVLESDERFICRRLGYCLPADKRMPPLERVIPFRRLEMVKSV